MSEIQLIDLSRRYGEHVAVDGLSLTVPPGELMALLGPSGCGKSTTLRMIAGLLPTSGGDIRFDGESITRLPAEKRGAVMMFQNHRLFPHMSVAANVGFGLRMRGTPRREIQRRVTEMLGLVELSGYEDRMPRELSGGQAQRVALARSLVIEPRVLLLDEPLSNLDANLRQGMRQLIRRVQQTLGITTIFVTHDQEEAVEVADQIALMLDGVLQQVGTPRDFYQRPANLATARFFGGDNFVRGRYRDTESEAGTVETAIGIFRLSKEIRAAYSPSIQSNFAETRSHLNGSADVGESGKGAIKGPTVNGATVNETTPDVLMTVRPESVVVRPGPEHIENRAAGQITAVRYRGTATELTIAFGDLSLRAMTTPETDMQPGERVEVYLPPERIWILPAVDSDLDSDPDVDLDSGGAPKGVQKNAVAQQ